MRPFLAFLLLLAGSATVSAESGPTQPMYLVYWFAGWNCQGVPQYGSAWLPAAVLQQYAQKRADIREQTTPNRPTEGSNNYPRIRPPQQQLPTDDPEERRIIPKSTDTPKESPKMLPKPKAEKSVSVDQFMIPADKAKGEVASEIKLGIFNHSDRDVDLEINGETLKLPADQYVTLRLPRTFTWTIRGQKSRSVNVPNDADGIEIVFRR